MTGNARARQWEDWQSCNSVRKSHASWVVQMSATAIEIESLPAGSFPKGVDTHWITENRTLWNEQHRKAEECELVYEVSWIPEVSAWRSFLRSQLWVEAKR
jgi:hypothetical protein